MTRFSKDVPLARMARDVCFVALWWSRAGIGDCRLFCDDLFRKIEIEGWIMDRFRGWAPMIGACAFTVIFVELLTMRRWAEAMILLPVIVGLLTWDLITVHYYRAGWTDAADQYDDLLDDILDERTRAELYVVMAEESESPPGSPEAASAGEPDARDAGRLLPSQPQTGRMGD